MIRSYITAEDMTRNLLSKMQEYLLYHTEEHGCCMHEIVAFENHMHTESSYACKPNVVAYASVHA